MTITLGEKLFYVTSEWALNLLNNSLKNFSPKNLCFAYQYGHDTHNYIIILQQKYD